MPLADTAATATACQVAPSTIRKWAMRGWLTQHGTKRRRMYDLDEATELAEQRRRLDNALTSRNTTN